jgi:hypothetical protein
MNNTYDPFKVLTVNNLNEQVTDKTSDYSQTLYEELYNLFISFNDLSKTVLERISKLEERITKIEDKLLITNEV